MPPRVGSPATRRRDPNGRAILAAGAGSYGVPSGSDRKDNAMLQAFVFENVAVLVGPWDEPADPPEQGTRIEVRLTDLEPHRGSLSAAQRVVIDQPVFRADLFDRMDSPPGNLLSAHFHPTFDGVEPCDRIWSDEIKHDPTG